MDIFPYRKSIVLVTIIIAGISLFFASKVNFVFDLERFFPQGDDDLAYFYEFREEFEDDDNFLLIAFSDSQNHFQTRTFVKSG